MTKQYYQIELESSIYWQDMEKITVKNFKELRDHIKNNIEYFLKYHPITKEQKDKYQIKKIYKRIQKLGLYEDNMDKSILTDYKNPDKNIYKNRGYCFQVNYKDKEGNYEYLMEYMAFRVPKTELYKYANFKEIEN